MTKSATWLLERCVRSPPVVLGTAALLHAMMVRDETGPAALRSAISLAIGACVPAHGVTGVPLTRLWGQERPRPDGELDEGGTDGAWR